MPNFSKLHQSLKRFYTPLAIFLIALMASTLANYKAAPPHDSSLVLQSQDIPDITALVANRARIDYVMVAQPLSDSPRYVFKYKDDVKIHVVKVPINTHIVLEREVLLKNSIPYSIARDDFLEAHPEILNNHISVFQLIEGFVVRSSLLARDGQYGVANRFLHRRCIEWFDNITMHPPLTGSVDQIGMHVPRDEQK